MTLPTGWLMRPSPYVTQAYVTMLLAAGIDALVANPLDPDLMEVIRVVRERDAVTAYDRLLLRLYDVTKADVAAGHRLG